jgi:isopentenyl-diphosphate Delta-isomerase
MKETEVILVNEEDQPVGTMEKMMVHHQGLLHRAFSVFIFDRQGNMLLQKRAAGKYHGAGLWTNACCSHPYPGESTEAAAERRLYEELGFNSPLKKAFEFVYKANVENDLIEHEYDHVYIGTYEGEINPDEAEVSEYRFVDLLQIERELEEQPANFTTWFKIAFPRVVNSFKKLNTV